MIKRKDYNRPTMKVVQLQHQGMLMTSTQGKEAGVQSYNWNDVTEE